MTTVSDAKVFDALYGRFGVGDYDETTSTMSWVRWRIGQIARLKALRTKRGVAPEELLVAVDYCSSNNVYPKHAADLFKVLPKAKAWKANETARAETESLDSQIQSAIQVEMQDPDSRWLDRLIRAAGPGREEVYDAWHASRQAQGGASPTWPPSWQ